MTASQTPGRYGLWIETGLPQVLAPDSSPVLIGQSVEEALRGSRQGVPYPANPEELARPLLAAASVGSWRAFLKGTTRCSVEKDGHDLRITPWTREGSGFVPRTDEVITIQAESAPEVLGQALLGSL